MVVGGILIICIFCEGLIGNWIDKIFGILNGISNFILIEMEKLFCLFVDVLREV